MPIFRLDPDELWFPEPDAFEPHFDIVAVGGQINPAWILHAYRRGIFPWFNPGEELLWWHPRQRMVLRPDEVKIRKSTRSLLNQGRFEVRFNQNFKAVVEACQQTQRPGQSGTWITDELKHTFWELYDRGYGFSAESYMDNELAGGLYGLIVNDIFMGESMFSVKSNASKIAFIRLCQQLQGSSVQLIDCQIYNDYLASLGAYEITRQEFLSYL